jgi:hypothetical protein
VRVARVRQALRIIAEVTVGLGSTSVIGLGRGMDTTAGLPAGVEEVHRALEAPGVLAVAPQEAQTSL